jgi:regulator of sigma E protease
MYLNVMAWSPDLIWTVIQKGFWFVVVLGVLVSFHELGHLLAARWVGVKVLKYSIGFGSKLIGRQIGETEYLVSTIPLGGYVKLFGEDATETLAPEEQRRAFSHQSLPAKTLIVSAGPGFNFILAYIIFAGWLATGAPLMIPTFENLTPVVDAIRPVSPALAAGIALGDHIVQVNDKDILVRPELFEAVMKSNGQPLTLRVRRDGQLMTIVVTPAAKTIQENGKDVTLYYLGIEDASPVIAVVETGSPAMAAGLQEGDRVVMIEDKPIHLWSDMTALIKANPGRPLRLQVQRAGQRVPLTVTPRSEKATVDGKEISIGKIGVGHDGTLLQASNPFIAMLYGAKATWGWTEFIAIGVYKIITGEISRKNIGGPLTIASKSGEVGAEGASSLIFFIAILSVNLGALNLLPIPILDGGHLLFFLVEAVTRKPIGERQREIAQQIGLLLLLFIMVFALWNDIERVILPLFHS